MRIYGVGMDHLEHEECLLEPEQEFALAKLIADCQSLSKDELIDALVGAVSQRYALMQLYDNVLAENGIGFRLEAARVFDFTDERALKELFGYTPTDAEVEELANDAYETATMELDMDAIVMAPED